MTSATHRREIIEDVLAVWNESPHLRLGQLLFCATARATTPHSDGFAWHQDTFSIRDEELVEKLQALSHGLTTSEPSP